MNGCTNTKQTIWRRYLQPNLQSLCRLMCQARQTGDVVEAGQLEVFITSQVTSDDA
jgi:hypothetical protein